MALCELIQRPPILKAVTELRIYVEEACLQIETLGSYKDQHDLLHRLQSECYDHAKLEVKSFPGDVRSRGILEGSKLTLRDVLDRLRSVAAHRPLEPAETAWIENLASAHACLDAALAKPKAEQLRKALWWLDRVLSIQPSRINTLLIGAAKAVRLPRLVQALTTLCEGLSAPGLAEHVQRFEKGVTALAALNRNLFALIRDHDRWQEVDLEMRRIESSLLAQHPEELADTWPAVSPKLESLCREVDEPWAVDLEGCRKQVSGALKKRKGEGAPELFHNCRRHANVRFNKVDTALKEQCGELRKVASPLEAVLGFLS